MAFKNISAFLTVSLLLIASVNSVVRQAIKNPVCPAPGTLTLRPQALPEEYFVQSEHYSKYYDFITYNSVELFVKKVLDGGDTGFRIFAFSDQLSGVVGYTCQSSDTYDFVAVLSNLLVLKDPSSPVYYACIYEPSTTPGEYLPTVKLDLPSEIASMTKFVPSYYSDLSEELFVAVSDAVSGGVFIYDCTGTRTTGSTLTPTLHVALISQSFDEMIGNGYVFYNPAGPSIMASDNNLGQWAAQDSVVPITATDVVTAAPLYGNNLGVLVLQSSLMDGNIYIIGSIYSQTLTPADTVTLPTATTPYQSQTDTLLNFVVYSQVYFYWVNIDKFSEYRIAVNEGDIDITTMVDLALTGNKALLIYADRVDYYQIVGAGIHGDPGVTAAIQFIFSKPLSTSIGADGQYTLTLSCMCNGLKRFSCHSSTLNCLVIKKAGTACGVKDVAPVK